MVKRKPKKRMSKEKKRKNIPKKRILSVLFDTQKSDIFLKKFLMNEDQKIAWEDKSFALHSDFEFMVNQNL